MIDIPLTLFSGGAIAATTILVTFFTWLANRTMAHQGHFKHLEDKIDHLGNKIDASIKNIERMDNIHREDMKRMDDNIQRMDLKWDESIQRMDSKWERLFERLLIQDQQRGR